MTAMVCQLGDVLPPNDDPMTKAVLGPGTGLGVGLLVRAGGTAGFQWAGEGGHVDLGPRNEREVEVWKHLVPLDGRISGEQVLCGDGLVNVYRACCATDGVEPEYDQAADISVAGNASCAGTKQGMDSLTPKLSRRFRCSACTLGRIAGDLALTSMARGGVYIGGGIAQKILPFLKEKRVPRCF